MKDAKKELEWLRKKMDATNVVCGVGPTNAKLFIVGEAPGEQEDIEDMPFVGRSGDLLNKMLDTAGLSRDTIYITNVVKCRPKNGKANRPPTEDEIKACKGILWDELKEVKPFIVIPLGGVATKLILRLPDSKFVMGKHVGVGTNVLYMDALVYPMYHPSFLLRGNKQYIEKSISILREIKEIKNAVLQRQGF